MKINAWLLIGLIGMLVFGTPFAIYYYQAVKGDPGIWWTPKSMALTLDETRHDFELFVNDELLRDHLERGTLSVMDRTGTLMPLTSDDIEVRRNNWHATKAFHLHVAVYMALLLGAALMAVIVGILRVRPQKAGTTSNRPPP